MKKLTLLLILFTGIFICGASAKDIRILIVTGGHDFDRASFFRMFDSMKGISYQELKHPEANLQLGQTDPKTFDAVVFYDMPKTISEKEKESYYQLLKLGKGLLFLHHSLCSYQDWQEYKTIVGGKYHEEKNTPQSSSFQHEVTFPVIIANKKHPVTKGLKDFNLLDEVYGNTEVLPTVKVLLNTNNSLSSQIIGWSHQMENSRIVYIQPGHDKNSYNNADYQQLIRQAIGYVSKN